MENVANQSPNDFVICTGKQYSVKDFINMVCKELKIKLNGKEKESVKKPLMKEICVLLNVIKNILDHLKLIL